MSYGLERCQVRLSFWGSDSVLSWLVLGKTTSVFALLGYAHTYAPSSVWCLDVVLCGAVWVSCGAMPPRAIPRGAHLASPPLCSPPACGCRYAALCVCVGVGAGVCVAAPRCCAVVGLPGNVPACTGAACTSVPLGQVCPAANYHSPRESRHTLENTFASS